MKGFAVLTRFAVEHYNVAALVLVRGTVSSSAGGHHRVLIRTESLSLPIWLP
jgi:hypothetical protein